MPENPSNHLVHEKSPYLQQHVHNPVDWYPWGQAALTRARTENKPILLSIGYSTCHWCHVMAHESFDDETIAGLMNRYFVCIKVDREERPDLDKIYITAVSAMTGSAGWPLNVFLTPEGHPFYGGTYFPPRARPGAPGWLEILQTIADHWADPERKDRLLSSGQNVTATLQEHLTWQRGGGRSVDPLVGRALERIRTTFDTRNGGFGNAPKFPSPPLLQFLLTQMPLQNRDGEERGTPSVRRMVTQTLNAMARGGIFDHLGGGFHRYATDAAWQVPHFEKMLYDNGQLLSVYVRAYHRTGDATHAGAARRIADYLLRDMQHPDGGFYAAEDADSLPPGAPPGMQKKEGAYFTWSLAEIQASDFQHHWLQKALLFTEAMVEKFYDADTGGFFQTRPEHDPGLILRVKEDADRVMPSASAVAALNLLRLARLTGRQDLLHMAAKTIDSGLTRMQAHPEAAPCMLLAHRVKQAPFIQIAIAGEWDHPATREMIEATRRRMPEGQTLAWVGDADQRRQAARDIPFLERALPLEGQPTAYVCVNRSCRGPLTSPSELAALLRDCEGMPPAG